MAKYLIYITLFFALCIKNEAQCNMSYLKSRITDRIVLDNLNNKDTSFYLFHISTGMNVKKWRGDQFNDTVLFKFRKDCYLRFYLIAKGLEPGQSCLKLITNSGKINTEPRLVVKEILNSGKDEEISVFEYYLKETEDMLLVLNQNTNSKGCSFAAAIQFRRL